MKSLTILRRVAPRHFADPGVSSSFIWLWPPLSGFLLIECLGALLFAPPRALPACVASFELENDGLYSSSSLARTPDPVQRQ